MTDKAKEAEAKKAADDSAKPTGVHKADAPSKAVPPQTSPPAVDHLKKDDKETAGPASAGNVSQPVKPSDTPETDVGKGGTVATTGNESPNKVAEPNTPNTPNPSPKSAGQVDTPPAAGLETPSGGVRTSTGDGNALRSETPPPPDKTPVPDDKTLDELDARHGLTKGDPNADDDRPTKTSDKDDYEAEKAAVRKFVSIAEKLPEATPDSGVFGGYGGVVINYGDIRNIAKAGRRSLDD